VVPVGPTPSASMRWYTAAAASGWPALEQALMIVLYVRGSGEQPCWGGKQAGRGGRADRAGFRHVAPVARVEQEAGRQADTLGHRPCSQS
jgi:hypothetical protein